jgi:hypothetical protein
MRAALAGLTAQLPGLRLALPACELRVRTNQLAGGIAEPPVAR